MNCIMHIPWQLLGQSVSATEIRPLKMKQAFEDLGYHVYFVSGRAAERKKLIERLKKKIVTGEKFDFLYSESSTLPMLLTEPHHLPTHPGTDVNLFALAKHAGIPIGLFYRDLFWAFPEIKRFGRLKRYYTNMFHLYEIRLYNRYLDAFYYPLDDREKVYGKLKTLNKRIPYYPLSAGADLHQPSQNGQEDYFVYIGGNRPDLHDLTVLMQAFGRVPEKRLKICTPRKSWEHNKKHYQPYLSPNIEILHLVNSEAQELLSRAKYGLNYFPDSVYRQYTTTYKLFEYAGYDLPVICNRNDPVGQIVKELGIGYPIEHSVEILSRWLRKTPSEEAYKSMQAHIAQIKKQHSWQMRAKTVRDTLCGELRGTDA